MTVQVGQRVWFVPEGLRQWERRQVTITRIKHGWAELDNGVMPRMEVSTWRAPEGQGCWPPGYCFETEEAIARFVS